MNNAPIGVFDSGLGGLTVARAIIDKLPDEGIVYLGDTANTPYGPRSIAEVRQLTIGGLDALVERGVKMLVVACNTATAAALSDAHERYWIGQGIPVVEVISPAATEAASATRNGRIGVIGTEATVNSGAYVRALTAVPGVHIEQQACPRFVDLVERGVTTGPEVMEITAEYLAPLQAADVDTVILGCTHYPLLTGPLSMVMGGGVRLVASSEATANAVYSKLVDLDLVHEPRELSEQGSATQYQFLTTSESPTFSHLSRRFLGPEVQQIEIINVESSGGAL